MLQTGQSLAQNLQTEQALLNALNNLKGQIEQGLNPNARLRLNNETEKQVGDALKNLLNLPEGATITAKADYFIDKLGRPTSPALYGTLNIPQPDGTNIRLAYGLNDSKGIYIGSELLGNQSMDIGDLNRGLNLSWTDAQKSLPLILEGSKAQGRQIPILRDIKSGEVVLIDSDTDISKSSNGRIGASVLRGIQIVSQNEDGSIKVENPTEGQRLQIPQTRKDIQLGIVEYNVQLKTAAGKQYEIQVSNNGSIGPTFNAKSADPSEYKSDNSEGAGSNIETLIKVEGP